MEINLVETPGDLKSTTRAIEFGTRVCALTAKVVASREWVSSEATQGGAITSLNRDGYRSNRLCTNTRCCDMSECAPRPQSLVLETTARPMKLTRRGASRCGKSCRTIHAERMKSRTNTERARNLALSEALFTDEDTLPYLNRSRTV